MYPRVQASAQVSANPGERGRRPTGARSVSAGVEGRVGREGERLNAPGDPPKAKGTWPPLCKCTHGVSPSPSSLPAIPPRAGRNVVQVNQKGLSTEERMRWF